MTIKIDESVCIFERVISAHFFTEDFTEWVNHFLLRCKVFSKKMYSNLIKTKSKAGLFLLICSSCRKPSNLITFINLINTPCKELLSFSKKKKLSDTKKWTTPLFLAV